MEKAIRMKTTRQLKEMLTDLGIEFKKGASKDDLRALVWEHDALSRYEAAHPEKASKKKSSKKGRGSRGGGGRGGDPAMDEQLRMMFEHIDTDQDGLLSAREVSQSGYFRVQGMEESEESDREMFRMLDQNGDGGASEEELAAFFVLMQQQQEAMAGGEYMDPYEEQVDDYQPDTARNVVGDDTCDYASEEEDESIPDP